MTPTAEQRAILRAAADTKENLLITARAGAAKTTTLVMIAEKLSPLPILCIAFNKKIAEELQQRLPAGTEAKTMNALGHRAWWKFTGKRINLQKDKIFSLLSAAVTDLDTEEQEEVREDFSETLRLIREARLAGYLPKGVSPLARPLISRDDLSLILDPTPTPLQLDLIDVVLRRAFQRSLDGTIDFDDQIYLPAIVPAVSFDTYPLVMVDEAQDLSPLNHIMLKKIVRKNRIIAVGDDAQAIYGFRGASENSMSELPEIFQMRSLSLTICFRSAEAIVENARWRAPDMQWRPDAPLGLVEHLEKWSVSTIPDGAAIICRNNAPLFRVALDLLRARRSPELYSGDVIPRLVNIMKKLGPPGLNAGPALEALIVWKEKELIRAKSKNRVEDTAACIELFLEENQTLADAIEAVEAIARLSGRIKLMTGHKSKGLEFNQVFFLDRFLCKDEGQDRNIRYVIETRAREHLTYIDSTGYYMAG